MLARVSGWVADKEIGGATGDGCDGDCSCDCDCVCAWCGILDGREGDELISRRRDVTVPRPLRALVAVADDEVEAEALARAAAVAAALPLGSEEPDSGAGTARSAEEAAAPASPGEKVSSKRGGECAARMELTAPLSSLLRAGSGERNASGVKIAVWSIRSRSTPTAGVAEAGDAALLAEMCNEEGVKDSSAAVASCAWTSARASSSSSATAVGDAEAMLRADKGAESDKRFRRD
jgi:hypothetical protein